MLGRCEYGLGKTRVHLFGLAYIGVQARLVLVMAAAAHDCLAQMILGDVWQAGRVRQRHGVRRVTVIDPCSNARGGGLDATAVAVGRSGSARSRNPHCTWRCAKTLVEYKQIRAFCYCAGCVEVIDARKDIFKLLLLVNGAQCRHWTISPRRSYG